jgi:hypothetical protein
MGESLFFTAEIAEEIRRGPEKINDSIAARRHGPSEGYLQLIFRDVA